MPRIAETLPEHYQRILPELFHSEIPAETKATCANCAMCEPSAEIQFRPDTKCCTYYPSLPNYLIGAIVKSTDSGHELGRSRILAKIQNKKSVTPFGVSAEARYNFLYQNSKEFFGRSKDMLCPYYDEEGGGQCTIWAFREAVCSTYFCKHVGGADGRRFWMSLKSYLSLIEQQLSRYAIYTIYPEYLLESKHPAEPPARPMTAEELENKPPKPDYYKKIWGSWQGMELEFFEECDRLISSLSKADLEKILGLDGEVAEAAVKRTLDQWLKPELPKALKLNTSLKIDRLSGDEILMKAYSELDALAVSTAAYEMLQAFGGDEPVTLVRQKLRQEKQSDFSDEVLLSLYQHRVLVEP